MAPRGGPRSGLLPVKGGFSQMLSAGREQPSDLQTGKRGRRRQFRLKLAIDESYGPPQVRRALAVSRIVDLCAMRDALVDLGRGEEAELLMRKAGMVADDEEKFQFAIAAAKVVMSRPSQIASEASGRFKTWGQLARAWCSQELARLYPGAGYAKKSAEGTDEPRVEFLCKYIEHVPLAAFCDDDYWRAMRPARERCKTTSTFKAYAQVLRRVIKIAVELKCCPVWPLSAVCKLPKVAKGEAPEFPFLYPEEFCRLMRCALIPIQYRVLWGFIIREGLRISEAYRIRWEHLAQLENGRWVLNVPATKTGRALMFVLNRGTGEVLSAFKLLRPELSGPFAWLSATNLKKAAIQLRTHVEQSGTTRERLLSTDGRLRRLREHDLRSTFVTWCKLAGVDNETIAQHTGHESSTMIARYNRSKATLEHLGLAPYLPLDQAMGLDVSGELGARLLGSGDVEASGVLLAEGEVLELTQTSIPPAQQTSAAAGERPPRPRRRQAVAAAPGAAPASSGAPAASAAPGDALARSGWPHDLGPEPAEPDDRTALRRREPPCPECERPMARVAGPHGRGWTCPSCNAAGDVEGDWTEPGGPPVACNVVLHDATGRNTSPGADALGKPRDQASADKRTATPSTTLLPVDPGPAPDRHASPEGGARGRADREAKPLNTCNGRDPGCDHGHSPMKSTAPRNEKSSMFDAQCAREGSNLHTQRVLEPKSEPGRPEATNPAFPGADSAPEATGSDGGSHPGVTTPAAPASPLELLQAAGRAYFDAGNWAALRALEPLIDAERVRLSDAAHAKPREPTRLEVVRAKRGAS